MLLLTALVLLSSYSLLNNVSMNCVICIRTHIAVTDVFVHFSSEENSQKMLLPDFGSNMQQIVCRPQTSLEELTALPQTP